MSWWRTPVVAALVLSVAACADDAPPSMADGLLRASDLPGDWQPFAPGQPSDMDLCGTPRGESRVQPLEVASVAWAVDTVDGPIVGQRVERFATPEAASGALDDGLDLPCEFESDGSRWRTERLSPPTGGDGGRVFLVTSRDRDDSYNYEVAVRRGRVVIRLVLNSRTEDRRFVDELVAVSIARAVDAGVFPE